MCSLLGQHSSIHHEGSAGGKFRVVGTEIENRRGDFFAGANAPDRMKRHEVIAHLAFFSGKAIDHVGCNTGGATALIRIFCLANSSARALVKPSTACLDAV